MILLVFEPKKILKDTLASDSGGFLGMRIKIVPSCSARIEKLLIEYFSLCRELQNDSRLIKIEQ